MLHQPAPSPALDALFNPRSVALVGVSDKPDSYGHAMLSMCRGGGFAGRIMGVNPRLSDPPQNVFAALCDLPETPDHVVLCVSTDRVEAAVEDALAAGAKALTIFAECPDADMRRRIGDRVRSAGAVMCGPNSMGLHDLTHGLRITPFPAPLDLSPGGIGLIVQSGSVLGALMNNSRALRFCRAVSTGSETVTTAADYLDWMAGREETKAIGLFLESVRDPQGFMAALEKASTRDIPVVVLKVGRSALGAKMALSHTGALVGDDAVFRAMVTRLGGHLADSLDEMAAMLAVFSQGRRAPVRTIASVHDSGGERELLADMAEGAGLRFATLSEQTRATMLDVLEPGLKAENPLDAWGTGQGAERSFAKATEAMMADPGVGAGLYVLNWRDGYYLHEMHERALTAAHAKISKPLIAVSNYSQSDGRGLARGLSEQGIPMVFGMQNAVAAVKALVDHRPTAPRVLPLGDFGPAADWRARLDTRDWLGETEGYALFSDYGIAVPRHLAVTSRDEARAFAVAIGAPVILKTAKPGLSHKSDHDGVRPGLETADQVAAAYDEMAGRLGAEALVAEMLPKGIEWALGAVNDPDFGPVIRIAPGGILIDLLPEQVLLPAPFDAKEARSAILTLHASALLTGYRGQEPLALDALAETAAALSRLAWDLRDHLAEAEINPVFVTRDAAIAADAVLRARDG
jgi:acyl-CoA synthetase (NDP forming)